MKRQNLRTVSLIVVTFTYLLIGAAIFGHLESENELRQREYLEWIEGKIKRRYNISEEDFTVLTTAVIKSVPHKAGIQWKFPGAFYFATTVVTTIGYGHSTPSTMAGRSFCMVYALIGIPLGLVMFQSIGERLNTFVGSALRYAKRCFKTKNPEVTQTNLVMVVLVLSTILMTSMAAVFAKYERWEYFDALYYCFITLTTIGFGDYVALQKESALQSKPEYVALSLIFILFGLSVVSSAVNLLVLKFLTLNTEDERRDEQMRYTAALGPATRVDGDVITTSKGQLRLLRKPQPPTQQPPPPPPTQPPTQTVDDTRRDKLVADEPEVCATTQRKADGQWCRYCHELAATPLEPNCDCYPPTRHFRLSSLRRRRVARHPRGAQDELSCDGGDDDDDELDDEESLREDDDNESENDAACQHCRHAGPLGPTIHHPRKAPTSSSSTIANSKQHHQQRTLTTSFSAGGDNWTRRRHHKRPHSTFVPPNCSCSWISLQHQQQQQQCRTGVSGAVPLALPAPTTPTGHLPSPRLHMLDPTNLQRQIFQQQADGSQAPTTTFPSSPTPPPSHLHHHSMRQQLLANNFHKSPHHDDDDDDEDNNNDDDDDDEQDDDRQRLMNGGRSTVSLAQWNRRSTATEAQEQRLCGLLNDDDYDEQSDAPARTQPRQRQKPMPGSRSIGHLPTSNQMSTTTTPKSQRAKLVCKCCCQHDECIQYALETASVHVRSATSSSSSPPPPPPTQSPNHPDKLNHQKRQSHESILMMSSSSSSSPPPPLNVNVTQQQNNANISESSSAIIERGQV